MPDTAAQYALANLIGVPSMLVASTPWPHWLPAPVADAARLVPPAGARLAHRDAHTGAFAGHADVLRAVADWLDDHPVPGVGTVTAAPDAVVSVHVEPLAAGPPPADVLRRYAETLPSATLTTGASAQMTDRVRANPVRLHVPLPGVHLVLWCFELTPPAHTVR